MTNNIKWPLAVSNMTLWDRLKISKWIITEDQWTQGSFVKDYEKRWEKYTGAKHVIMTANGSVANELIALRRKWELQQSGEWPKKNKVVFPIINWISSISVWINFGFEPIFVDVGDNLCSTPKQVEEAISRRDDVAAVFYTTLLGFSGGVDNILKICAEAGVPLYLDNCESSFTRETFDEGINQPKYHISSLVTSSTSLFFSHHTSGQGESGLVFCQNDEEADWYRMARSHGMTRGMPDKYKNPNVDPSFDFYVMGSNYRSTNLNAYMCSLDLDRAIEFGQERQILSELFSESLHLDRFEHPHYPTYDAIPLSLPIVVRPNNYGLIDKIKKHLKDNRIEYRPIISGNLLYQTAFKKYGDPKSFPRADYLHYNGVYVGLHRSVTREMVVKLGEQLSSL